MNIQDVQNRIQLLEKDVVSNDRTQELASLYIIRDHLQKSAQNQVEREIDDILPAYKDYVKEKIEYQHHNVDEEKVVYTLDLLCIELQEFLEMLYSSTNLYKERRKLQNMIESVSVFYKQ